MNKKRENIIKRAVYETISLNSKGTKAEFHAVEELYKKRRHKSCQNVFEKANQACKYFDAVEHVIETLLKDEKKTRETVFSDLEERHGNFKTHVLVAHKTDMKEVFTLVKEKIVDFNTSVQAVKDRYKIQQETIDRQKHSLVESLRKRKTLDQWIVVKTLRSKSAETDKLEIADLLDAGADIVVLDESKLFSRSWSVEESDFSVEELVGELTKLQAGKETVIYAELLKLLECRNPVSLEEKMFQGKGEGSAQKQFYKALALYFRKNYLKKKLEIKGTSEALAQVDADIRTIRRRMTGLKEDKRQVERKENYLKFLFSLNEKELTRLEMTSVADSYVLVESDFKEMQILCEQMEETVKLEMAELMTNLDERKTELEGFKARSASVECSSDALSELKPMILRNRLKIGLKYGELKHRCCDKNCDFFLKLNVLIDETIKQIFEGIIEIDKPLYEVSLETQKRIIKRLNIADGHSKRHKNVFKRVVTFVAEEYGKAREQARMRHDIHIQEAQREIDKFTTEAEALKSVFISALRTQAEKIKTFFQFRQGRMFVDTDVTPATMDVAEKDLFDYQERKFRMSFKNQVNHLILLFEKLDSLLRERNREKLLNSAESNDIQETFVNPLTPLIGQTFSDFFEFVDLNQNLISALLSHLKQELMSVEKGFNEGFEHSRLWVFLRKKGGQRGIEFLVKKISWDFQQSTDQYQKDLDPELLYYGVLQEERRKKSRAEESAIELLQLELSSLEQQRKEKALQDPTILFEELGHLEASIKCLQNYEEICALRCRVEELHVCKENKDDYFSFSLDGRRVCVRLVKSDPREMFAEIQHINRVRGFSEEQTRELLKKKILREHCTRDASEEGVREKGSALQAAQRRLFWKGLSICGYDTWENGQPLDPLNGLIAVVVEVLLGGLARYQVGGINEVSDRGEGWVRKFRSQWDQWLRESREKEAWGTKSLTVDREALEFVLRKINEEFQADGSSKRVAQLNIIYRRRLEKVVLSHAKGGKVVTLESIGGQFFAIVPLSDGSLLGVNRQAGLSLEMSHILTILQTEEDLFKFLCEKRLTEVLRVNLETSKKLGELLKTERKNLREINSLSEFNALFCGALDLVVDKKENLENVEQGKHLLAYLVYLETLENSLKKDEIEEKKGRLKLLKGFYEKTLLGVIKLEQQRRNLKAQDRSKISREELYLTELVQEKEEELTALSQDILEKEQSIEKDQNLINSLLLEKETTMDKYRDKCAQLSSRASDLKEKLKVTQERLSDLRKSQADKQAEVDQAQESIARLEAELAAVELELGQKENDKIVVEQEIQELRSRSSALENDLRRVEVEKTRKIHLEAAKANEIEIAENVMLLIKNLREILGNPVFQALKNDLNKCMYESADLRLILEALRVLLEAVKGRDGASCWVEFVRGVNYQRLVSHLDGGKKTAGELQHDLVSRLRAIVRDALHVECELVQELAYGKPIRRFKVVGTNVGLQDIQGKLKECVEQELNSSAGANGLSFQEDLLFCSEYGVNEIQGLPAPLAGLVNRRIELHYKTEQVKEKKISKFAAAAAVINELKIDYKEVVHRFVDEVEVVCSGNFLLDSSCCLPGVDLTVSSVNLECVGENLVLDSSGRDGVAAFHQAASNGCIKRSNHWSPRGDDGYDGVDGEHGGNAGNIVIRVENEALNLAALTAVRANGGRGAHGQLGGDGDQGRKGVDGEDGKAPDTNMLGTAQTCIGFGKPGGAGGPGGAPGATGRPGLGGKRGVINFTHKAGPVIGESTDGQDASNILEERTPSGGEGGEPGLFGMDEVKDKKGFFKKMETVNTVVNREALIDRYPEWKLKIRNGDTVTKTNSNVLIGTIVGAVTSVWTVCAVVKTVTTKLILGVSTASAIGGGLVGTLFGSAIKYQEPQNLNAYRDRQRTEKNRRGRNNEQQAQLRTDNRAQQEEKREATNIDSLHNKLSEKKREELEISGSELHRENISDLRVQQEELQSEIEHCTQEIDNITSERETVAQALEIKGLELEQVLNEIHSLRTRGASLSVEKANEVNRLIRAISQSQGTRDKRFRLELDCTGILNHLQRYQTLGTEFMENNGDLIRILTEFLEVVRARLDRNRAELKILKDGFSGKKAEIRAMKKRIEDLRNERMSQVNEIEVDIDQEMELEVETEIEQELVQTMDFEKGHSSSRKTDVLVPGHSGQTSYLSSVRRFEPEKSVEGLKEEELSEFLNYTLRHYRAGVMNDEDVDIMVKEVWGKYEKKIFVCDEVRKEVESFKKDVKLIKMSKKIACLNTVKRQLLFDTLIRINSRLEKNNSASIHEEWEFQEFILENVCFIDESVEGESKIAENFRFRFKNENLLGNDTLKEDVDILIGLNEDLKVFHLENCAINFSSDGNEQSKYEKMMIAFNKERTLGHLKLVISGLKFYQKNIKNAEDNFYRQSLNSFFSVVIQNIRFEGILAIDDILGRMKTYNKEENNDQENKDSFNQITEICNDLKSLNGKSENQSKTINVLASIMNLFNKNVSTLKTQKIPKKKLNREIKLFEIFTKKLIKYSDFENENISHEIEKIILEYFNLSEQVQDEKFSLGLERLQTLICNS